MDTNIRKLNNLVSVIYKLFINLDFFPSLETSKQICSKNRQGRN